MPGYLDKMLVRFNHEKATKIQNSPYPHVSPNYGAKIQYVEDELDSPTLSKEEKKYIQAVTGTLLYFARAVDLTILPALSAIATEQANPTEQTLAKVKQLLDYCATQDDAIIEYSASKMILTVHSDAGYCNEKNSRSRAGGHFYLSNGENDAPPQQWSNSNTRDNNKSSDVISGRSGISGGIFKCEGSSLFTTNTHRNWTSAATNTDSDRQFDG